MRKTVKINQKEISVDFSGYFDSAYGEFLFTQVMCDVFMPGNEVVPVAVEKEQIRKVIEGFKRRKALYEEMRKENVKGKDVYVITPRLRYDLEWLAGKKKLIFSKDKPPVAVSEAKLETLLEPETPESALPAAKTDARRKFMEAQGFRYDPAGKHWVHGSIRLPDTLIDKSETEEAFRQGITRLLEADVQAKRRRKPTT